MTDKSLLKAVLKLRKELGINGRCHIGFHYFISKISWNIFDWIKEKMVMTDKEIIIDGIDVRTCDSFIDYYMVDETRFQDVPEDIIEQDKLPMVYKRLPDCLLRKNLYNAHICHCKDKPNCHFKQLARKTIECEELKNKLNEYERAGGILDEGEAWYHIAQRYEQAFNEIEQYIKDNLSARCRGCTWRGTDGCEGIECLSMEIRDILDIIHKAKKIG